MGLDPCYKLCDAEIFKVYRARIPTTLFKEIVQDIEIAMKQYGPPMEQEPDNEEARSRFLAPVSVCALFL